MNTTNQWKVSIIWIKTAAYKINLRSKKWWWLPFHFVIDVSVKTAFQLYQMKEVEGGEKKLYALRFGRAIVDAYFRLYQQSKSFGSSLEGSRLYVLATD